MKIDHIAIWTDNLNEVKDYYIRYFKAVSNDMYVNKRTGFNSYFLSFESGARIEIMHRGDIPENKNDTINTQYKGLIHFAFVVNTMAEVDSKAKELEAAGYRILNGPRKTGDGYYEFETLDPENNRLEVCSIYNEDEFK